MNKLYLNSKKIHRFLVVIITVLILIMSLTGGFLKFPQMALSLSLDLRLIRTIHNQLSFFFSLALVFMATSGIIMYFFPIYLQRKNRAKMP